MNFLPGSLRGHPSQQQPFFGSLKSTPMGNGSRTSLSSSRPSLSHGSSPTTSGRPSQDLLSSTSSLGAGERQQSDQGQRPPPAGRRLSRRSISRHPPTGTTESAVDVLDVLNGILGITETKNEAAVDTAKPLTDFSFLDKALNEPVPENYTSLGDLASSGEHIANDSDVDTDLKNLDQKMDDYKFLRATIEKSDKQLEDLQLYLASFQKELDTLSADMEFLEKRSEQIGKKLEVRQAVEKKLAPIVEALIIPPMIVRHIADGEISLQWRSSLKYVMQRQSELELLKERGDFNAIKGAEGQLKLVGQKAIERIRDFIVSRIKALRVPGVNSQSIQKELLNYRDLYAFIKKSHPALAQDLLQAYVNTMTWYYGNYFQRYAKSLEKINLHKVDKSVLLGSDDTSRRGLLFYQRSAQPAMKSMDTLNLGNRANIIASDDPSVMLSQIAETNNMVRLADLKSLFQIFFANFSRHIGWKLVSAVLI